MKRPAFSIIMPAHNAESTIDAAIASVLHQSFSDFELIVIDDCSTDKTKSKIRSYEYDFRVRPVFLTENCGVATARNQAIARAKGKYIAFLDSDDLWMPNKLEKQEFELKKGAAVVFSSYQRFDQSGDRGVVFAKPVVAYTDMLLCNWIGNLTGVYDCEKIGKVYQKEVGHEDYLMWLEIVGKSGTAVGMQEILAKYCVASDSLSGNKLRSSRWVWLIYRQHLKLGFLGSLKSFFFYALYSLYKRVG
ncbi:glycosyltransferase family 2 protein [Halomonas beimenensis]|uniref:Putative N-acetylgalactosaminyl-diphosphoundecaprenol glucuronosyltransferase n=1 Tax=Halomonas beimenensis TaxID=475662 RepID=A0A291P729_9GAMM|nr:glycosyltransferase family 2 protein [Halomonas beimenensis]ATJ82678.1 putative N-acetylgalactosaminyl-diphosphoundecaprenol glucuronosyltransferase [Halomonas beimenensis]